MEWTKELCEIESLTYDGSKACDSALMERDLFVVKHKDGRTYLLEMFGLNACKNHGEIRVGDTVILLKERKETHISHFIP